MGLLMEYEVVNPESKNPLDARVYRDLCTTLQDSKTIVKQQRKTGALTKSGPERAWFWKLAVTDDRADVAAPLGERE